MSERAYGHLVNKDCKAPKEEDSSFRKSSVMMMLGFDMLAC
jgi:hypothetical protein